MFSLSKKTIIFAHRGARGLTSTENSFESFDKTIEVGGTWVELDVRKTKDNKFIVLHDKNLNGISIKDMNLEEINSVKSEVKELKDILIRYKGKLNHDIELKEEGDEEEIVQIIKQYLDYNEFFISSFSEKTVAKVKNLDKKIKTGLLIHKNKRKLKSVKEYFSLCRMRKTKADFIIIHYSLMKYFFNRLNKLNKPIIVWTVNDPALIKKFKKIKVGGIITDRPDIALKI